MTRRLLLLVLLLGFGCAGKRFQLDQASEALIRERMQKNFAAFESLEISWRANLESRRLGQIPFRMDLDWSSDSILVVIRSPFGGELARLRGRPGGFAAASGDRLPSWLRRAARSIDSPAINNLLESGLESLFGNDSGPYKLELSDPALAPLLNLAAPQLPGDWLEEGLLAREDVGPWLWGAWQPPADARWDPDSLSFNRGGDQWRLDPQTGFCSHVAHDGWIIELSDFRRRKGCWLPAHIVFLREDRSEKLVLARRSLNLRK